MTHSEDLFARAQTLMPGGVNSPVRAFGSVGGTPRFLVSAQGPYVTDADDRRYVDLVCSWGPASTIQSSVPGTCSASPLGRPSAAW